MVSPSKVKQIGQTVAPRLYRHLRDQRHAMLGRAAKRILAQSDGPEVYDSDQLFERLRQSYGPRPEYGFDAFSTWRRGNERALKILRKLDEFQRAGIRVLEAGCGDGMTGHAFGGYGHTVTLTDLEDWRDDRAKSMQFIPGNICDRLPLESERFDLILSFNAFEHFENPGAALTELIRLCKIGGYIFLEFTPLYASPWGLHAFSTIFFPYPQFLFSMPFIENKVRELGMFDLGEKRTTLQPVNGWLLDQYDALWRNADCQIVSLDLWPDYAHLDVIKRFPKAFTGRGLTFEDVTTDGVTVVLQRLR